MVNIWYFRAALMLGVLAGFYGIYRMGAVDEQAKIALQDKAAIEKKWEEAFKLSSDLEKQLAAQRETNEKLKEDLDDEIAKNGVYRACVVPADGVRLYNAAVSGAPAR